MTMQTTNETNDQITPELREDVEAAARWIREQCGPAPLTADSIIAGLAPRIDPMMGETEGSTFWRIGVVLVPTRGESGYGPITGCEAWVREGLAGEERDDRWRWSVAGYALHAVRCPNGTDEEVIAASRRAPADVAALERELVLEAYEALVRSR